MFILSLGRFFNAYLFRALPHQVVGVVMLVAMVELEVVVVLQEHLLKTGAFLFLPYELPDSEMIRSFNMPSSIVLSGLKRSTLCLRNSTRNNLNGQFLTPSCENLLDLQLLKSCCLPIDHL